MVWFRLPDEFSGVAAGRVALRFAVDSESLSASGSGNFVIDRPHFRDVAADPIRVQVDVTELQRSLPAGDWFINGQARADVAVNDIEISRVLQFFDSVPGLSTAPLSGHVTARGTVTVPLSSAEDPATYEATVGLSAESIGFGDLQLRDLKAALDYSRGLATVTNFQ